MKAAAVIVAGGKGLRSGLDEPKQFFLLDGKPLIWYSLAAFAQSRYFSHIVLVLAEEWVPHWHRLCTQYGIGIPHQVALAGPERWHSVKSGLQALPEDTDLVAVHDSVRPFIDASLIDHLSAEAWNHDSAIPVVAVRESVREVRGKENHAVDRNSLRLVQTPQVFRFKPLLKAFRQPFNASFSDEASVWEATGRPVHLVPGQEHNIKLTSAVDFACAHEMLRSFRGEDF